MNLLRSASVTLAVIAAAVLMFGTVGFGSTTADRGMSVAVVDDDNAYVGYETSDIEANASDEVSLVEITNRFGSDTAVDVVNVTIDVDGVNASGIVIEPAHLPDSIGPGESGTVTGTVEQCSLGETGTVQVTVEVEGGDVKAEILGDPEQREFEINCVSA